MFCYLIKKNSEEIINTIDNNIIHYLDVIDSNHTCKTIKKDNNTYKVIFVTINEYTIQAITDEKTYIKSSKILKKEIEIIHNSIDRIENTLYEIKNNKERESYKHAKRLIHNLVTINGQNLQHVHLVIPQSVLETRSKEKGTKEKIKALTEIIEEKTEQTARSLLGVAKNSARFKSEINVYNTIINEDKKLNIKKHSIHRVIMNSFYVFFPEFTDSYIKINVHKSNDSVAIDYDSFQVALYHLIDNASKYSKPHSELEVAFKKDKNTNKINIIFSMISLKIDLDEADRIFEEGYSGKAAIKIEKQGSGIGMSRIKMLLKKSDSTIAINLKPDEHEENYVGHIYQRNFFTITANLSN